MQVYVLGKEMSSFKAELSTQQREKNLCILNCAAHSILGHVQFAFLATEPSKCNYAFGRKSGTAKAIHSLIHP